MPSFLENSLKQNCSGCGACAQSCALGAIKMEKDEEGFLYPLTDGDKCVRCGRCVSVCPFSSENKNEQAQDFFAAKSKEKQIINGSSSGGAFYEISKAFCSENYAVFGAEMTDDLKVCHSFATDFSEISKFQKSKYVQSNTGDSFKKAKEFLDGGTKVLFSGTPCQIAGFKNFLGKDYENLITVDIVCHGVPPQELFDKYLDELSEKLGEKITSFTFRNKKNFDKKNPNLKTALIKTESGREIVKEVPECEYLAAFYDVMIHRPSCGSCPFAELRRTGDITLGDFWGADKFFGGFDDGKGVSLVIANTDKGKLLLEKAPLDCVSANRESVLKYNTHLRVPASPHENRDKFFELLKTRSFCESVRECMDIPSPLRYRLYKIKTFIRK